MLAVIRKTFLAFRTLESGKAIDLPRRFIKERINTLRCFCLFVCLLFLELALKKR
jgi:hypothetical protein